MNRYRPAERGVEVDHELGVETFPDRRETALRPTDLDPGDSVATAACPACSTTPRCI